MTGLDAYFDDEIDGLSSDGGDARILDELLAAVRAKAAQVVVRLQKNDRTEGVSETGRDWALALPT